MVEAEELAGVQVNPARAGMIRDVMTHPYFTARKPRTRGDDPDYGWVRFT